MREYFIWLLKFITVLVVLFVVPIILIVSFVSFLATASNIQNSAPLSKEAVAVIELNGEIMSSKEVLEELYKQVKNPAAKAIVLRIDSPGGAVAPSQDIYQAVSKLKAKKPIVVSMGSTAASGGLYSALGASKIFCQPGTATGSIGVIMQIPNLSNIADKVGFEMVTIRSGKYKDAGNVFREMTPDEKELLNNMIQNVRSDFVQAVVDGRGLKKEDVEKFADGRVIIGSEALKLGLVDAFGDVYDASREAAIMAGVKLAEGEYPEIFYPADNSMNKVKKILGSCSKLVSNWLGTSSRVSEAKMLYM